MTEFQELVKDAPKFVSMERGELVARAYAMYAAGVKMDVENAKLRELLLDYDKMLSIAADELAYKSGVLRMDSVLNALRIRMHELGIEVPGDGTH